MGAPDGLPPLTHSVRYMKMKTKLFIAFGLLAVGLCLLVMPMPSVPQQECLHVWQEFAAQIKQADYNTAHSLLTVSGRSRWAATHLTGTGIAMYPMMLDAPVTRYRSSFLLGRTTFWATYCSPSWVPLCLEDGVFVEVRMRKEDGAWKLELPILHWK